MVQAINTVNSPVDVPSALTNLPQDNPQEILSFALKNSTILPLLLVVPKMWF